MVRGPKVVCVLIAHHNTYAQISINLNRVLIFRTLIRLPLFHRRGSTARPCRRLCTRKLCAIHIVSTDKTRHEFRFRLDVECCVVSLGHQSTGTSYISFKMAAMHEFFGSRITIIRMSQLEQANTYGSLRHAPRRTRRSIMCTPARWCNDK